MLFSKLVFIASGLFKTCLSISKNTFDLMVNKMMKSMHKNGVLLSEEINRIKENIPWTIYLIN